MDKCVVGVFVLSKGPLKDILIQQQVIVVTKQGRNKVVVVANSKQKVCSWTQLVVKYTSKNLSYDYTLYCFTVLGCDGCELAGEPAGGCSTSSAMATMATTGGRMRTASTVLNVSVFVHINTFWSQYYYVHKFSNDGKG